MNADFRDAIETWNAHRWRESDGKFKDYLRRHPNGAWAAEAELHIGCLACYEKDFKQGKKRFRTVLKKWPRTNAARKARLRLSNLFFATQEFDEALEQLAAVLKESPTWTQATYVHHFRRRVMRYRLGARKNKRRASLDCGIKSLAFCLDRTGERKLAKMMRSQDRHLERDLSLLDLKHMAKEYDIDSWGIAAERTAVAKLPMPFIAHLDYPEHFVVVDRVEGDQVRAFEPTEGRRTYSTELFARLWSGKALVFAKANVENARLLGQGELARTVGGCCGSLTPGDGPGPIDPEDPSPPDNPPDGGSDPDPGAEPGPGVEPSPGVNPVPGIGPGPGPGTGGGGNGPSNPVPPVAIMSAHAPSCSGGGGGCAGGTCPGGAPLGMPSAYLNPISFSVNMMDTPLYYRCQKGPSVYVTIHYLANASSESGPVGMKWHLSYDSYYTVEPGNNDVTVKRLNGQEHEFINDGQDNFTSPERVLDTLVKNQGVRRKVLGL